MIDKIDLKKKELTVGQASEIIKYCGYSYAEFSYNVGKTRNWYSNYKQTHRILEYRFYDELVEFVGKDNFKLAIERLNLRIKRKNDRIEELSN